MDEKIRLIESENRLGDGRVTVVEETIDSVPQSKAESVCSHHNNYFYLLLLLRQCFPETRYAALII